LAFGELSTTIRAIAKRLETQTPHLSMELGSDCRTLMNVSTKATGIDRLLMRSLTGEHIELEECVDVHKRVHAAFGAPGDWGYDHPIGKALHRLYSVSCAEQTEAEVAQG